MKLLLAIGKNSNEKDILHRLATYRYKDDVVLCLSVSETERIALIASSYAMICLGERSGYSIPLAEALCCSVPIIAADNPLFREIGGAGVLYFEENNLQDLSQNMMLLYKDEDLRTRCVHEIENRKLIFSEKNIVDQLRNLLLSASDNESPTFAV